MAARMLRAVRMLRVDWRWGSLTARERVDYRRGVAAAAADRRVGLAATARLRRTMRETLARR